MQKIQKLLILISGIFLLTGCTQNQTPPIQNNSNNNEIIDEKDEQYNHTRHGIDIQDRPAHSNFSWDNDPIATLDTTDSITKTDGRIIEIGATGISMILPHEYTIDNLTPKEVEECMIARFISPEHEMVFELFEFKKQEWQNLESNTNKDLNTKYGIAVYDRIDINDVNCICYNSKKYYNGIECVVENYLFETDEKFGRISFYMNGDDANECIDKIVGSLEKIPAEGISTIGQ